MADVIGHVLKSKLYTFRTTELPIKMSLVDHIVMYWIDKIEKVQRRLQPKTMFFVDFSGSVPGV
jgi:hypothetical protein